MDQRPPVILIAEDEFNLREMYVTALTLAGFEVLPAKNGEEALDWLEKRYSEINLILLDVVMPVMDGFETLENIKKDARFKEIAVLISTNLDNNEDRQQSIEMGARGYYIKSLLTPAELIAEINAILAEKK